MNGRLKWPQNWYANNRNIIPWWIAAQPYIKNTDVWACPSGNFRLTKEGVQPVPGTGINLAMQYMLSWGDTAEYPSPEACPWPAETVLFGDGRNPMSWAETMGFANMYPHEWFHLAPPIGTGRVEWRDGRFARHSGGTTLGFLDGHVKWVRWELVQAYERPRPIGQKCVQFKMWWPRYGNALPADCDAP